MRIGVLDLQGAVREHVVALEACGCTVERVKHPKQLAGLHGLVIPGGESTSIGRLMEESGLLEAVREHVALGLGVFGTCAGMVLLAAEIEGSAQPRLGLMNMRVCRNGFGRQRNSFECSLDIPALGDVPFPGVFIRAPFVTEVASSCEVLCRYDGRVVLVREGKLLAAAFHPELTDDLRLHRYFLSMLQDSAE